MRNKGVTMKTAAVLLAAICSLGWAQDVPAKPANGAAPAATRSLPPAAALSNEQIKELIRKSADNDIQNDLKQRDYTYLERSEAHYLDGKGNVKKVETETDEVLVLYGEQVERKIAKDDKPLPPKDAAKEEKKLQELIDKRKNESEEKRQKRQEKERKEREKSRQFVREIADAYDFQLVGAAAIDGHDTYIIDFVPHPGFQAHLKDARFLPKFRGRVWIDRTEFQVVRLSAEAIDTVSWGLFLARLHKGSHVLFEQIRVNDEVWLPKHVQANIDARLGLVVGLRMDLDVTYKDYQKFRSNTRILGYGETSTTAPPAASSQP